MSSANRTKTYSILAVDDTPDNLLLLEAILTDEGYTLDTATDGESALAQIDRSPPDLILLDVMMPGMSGYEVTRRIREHPTLPFIPIVLITAFERANVVEGLDLGADEFIRKPIDPDELLARVRSLLRLKQSIDDRELMMRQQDDFVSRVTHDLRTPLVAADRMLHLFLQEAFCPIVPEMKDALRATIDSNQNLLQMINTLLEVHRYDASQKQLVTTPCNLCELVTEVVRQLSPLAAEKNIELIADLPAGNTEQPAQTTIMGDRLELNRLLTNLVGNALKFTDRGGIWVRIDTTIDEWLTIEVVDTGAGIDAAEREYIFERFRPGKHRASASGLGLYLCRQIATAHGGDINVDSTVGKGSKFIVRLPRTNPRG
jgi:two-component system, sensor histidine kinase and response regulator